jgi:aminoglycoside phosphotransferase (APT) family kinase protein
MRDQAVEIVSQVLGVLEPGAPPLLVGERAWLLRNVPDSARYPVVVHNDIGFHNTLTDSGEVTALLDWTFCHSALYAFNERDFDSAAEAARLAVSGLAFGARYQLEVAELIAGASPSAAAS